jgi:hypothetical protein
MRRSDQFRDSNPAISAATRCRMETSRGSQARGQQPAPCQKLWSEHYLGSLSVAGGREQVGRCSRPFNPPPRLSADAGTAAGVALYQEECRRVFPQIITTERASKPLQVSAKVKAARRSRLARRPCASRWRPGPDARKHREYPDCWVATAVPATETGQVCTVAGGEQGLQPTGTKTAAGPRRPRSGEPSDKNVKRKRKGEEAPERQPEQCVPPGRRRGGPTNRKH